MNAIITIILIFIGFLTGVIGQPADPSDCGDARDVDGCRTPVTEWRSVTIDDIEGAIMPEDEAMDVISTFYIEGSVTAGWTITDDDIRELEAGIEAEAASVDPHGSTAPDSLAGYYRQYAGIVQDGAHKIFVNGFCSIDHIVVWDREFVFVLDGGTCYFQALYNVDTGEFESFSFNGNA